MPVGEIEDLEVDMLPPTGRTVRDMLGGGKAKEDGAPKARKRAPTAREKADNWAQLREDLKTGYEFLGFTMVTTGMPTAGMSLAENAERCADVWVAQAQKSERVHRFLMGVTTGSGWLAIGVAHMPITMAIMHDVQGRREPKDLPENMEQVFEDLMDKASSS